VSEREARKGRPPQPITAATASISTS
jgi:hypothetical protein